MSFGNITSDMLNEVCLIFLTYDLRLIFCMFLFIYDVFILTMTFSYILKKNVFIDAVQFESNNNCFSFLMSIQDKLGKCSSTCMRCRVFAVLLVKFCENFF
jgi:hypothetical protein